MTFQKCEFCENWDFQSVNFWIKSGFLPQSAQENSPGETKPVPEPQVSEVKDTKKEESSSSAPKDHAKVKKTKDKSEVQGDMGTLFILDLMKQRKEKMMRKKKDDMINELAMKKKQQIMEARMGKRVLTRPSFGGFVGVGKLRQTTNVLKILNAITF